MSDTLALLFGGCCSNAITTEQITVANPHAGILITFVQFLSVSVVPLLPYLLQVALFFVLSVLNNAAFAFDIPMSVHIVFRSGGMIINMLLGSLLLRKRYTNRQVLSVLTVTIGIILTTLTAPHKHTAHSHTTASRYAQGVAILALALLLSGLLGLTQDHVYARYIKPTDGPRAQPSWQESMFYNHVLALPLFYFSRRSIAAELARLGSSPLVSLPIVDASVPSLWLFLVANTLTQLLCVIGVNRLTGRVSSLTVTLILTVRKAISLLLSVAIYGRQTSLVMWIGAALVFVGTIAYSTGTQIKDKKE